MNFKLNMLLCCVLLSCHALSFAMPSHAEHGPALPDALTITGSTVVSPNSTVQYLITLNQTNPPTVIFQYDIELIPGGSFNSLISFTSAEYYHSFDGFKFGQYKLQVSVHLFENQTFSKTVAEGSLNIEVSSVVYDDFSDMITINGSQAGVPVNIVSPLTFASNKAVIFKPTISSLGISNLVFKWTITRCNVVISLTTNNSFSYCFGNSGFYNLTLEMTGSKGDHQMHGLVTSQIEIQEPISNMTIWYDKDVIDTETEMTINCQGASPFRGCYYVSESSVPIGEWCKCEGHFEFVNCPHKVTVAFDEEETYGWKYVHIGLENDVSEQWVIAKVKVDI